MVRDADPLLEGRPRDDIIIAITDADGQLERHALSSVAAYFADTQVGGLQIGVRIANASKPAHSDAGCRVRRILGVRAGSRDAFDR
jgi:hypothetical protein